jgi:DNA-binding LacI/PurR family transcriptional regulator
VPNSLHQSLAERIAAWISQRIQQGHFRDRLPGLRELAREIGVSVPTVSKGIHLLEKSGLVITGGARRGFRIAPSAKPSKRQSTEAPKSHKRLLFLTSRPVNQLLQDSMQTFAELVNVMRQQGWEVFHRSNGFEQAKAPHKSWDRMLELLEPDALVVLSGNAVVAKWALERKIPVLFLGGQTAGNPVPQVAVRITGLIEETIDRLRLGGHTDILMPLCGRTKEFANIILQAARRRLLEGGGKANQFRLETSAYSEPKVLLELLKRAWQKKRPDALVILDWREYVTASCFLKEQRIEVPNDLSVVLLSFEEEMKWHFPSIAHYRFPSERIAHAIARWALHDQHTGAGAYPKFLRAHWVEGQSIATRKPLTSRHRPPDDAGGRPDPAHPMHLTD